MKGRADLVDYLSRNTTNSLKGVMALMVLLCHLHGRVQLFSNSILGTLFTAFGYLAVSGFFFLSGYGLFLTMYRNIITNDIIYIIVVIVSVILVSVLISPVFKFINKSAKKLIQNK